jgi:hypothetical protein
MLVAIRSINGEVPLPAAQVLPQCCSASMQGQCEGGAMTATENIFLAWGLFCGGVTLIVVTLIWMFNATKRGRIQ